MTGSICLGRRGDSPASLSSPRKVREKWAVVRSLAPLAGRGFGGGASARVVTVVCVETPLTLNQTRRLFLKLALQRFDLFGQRRVLGDQCLDFANRVQHRGVVASAEAAADLRQ
jgi:hypothetical protein